MQIAQAPERWPILVDDLRKRPLWSFLYRVIYQFRGGPRADRRGYARTAATAILARSSSSDDAVLGASAVLGWFLGGHDSRRLSQRAIELLVIAVGITAALVLAFKR